MAWTAAEGDEEAPRLRTSGTGHRRQVVISIALAALLGAGAWFLIGQAANYSKLEDAVRRANPWWLVAAVLSVSIGYLGYALLYKTLAGVDGGPRPSLPVTLRVTIAVFGASVIATSAGRLGSEYWAMRKMNERPAWAWSRVLGLNTGMWAALAAMAWAGAALMLIGVGRPAPIWLELTWFLLVVVCLPPALFLSSPAHERWQQDAGGKVRRTFAAALRGLVLLRDVAKERRLLAAGATGSLLLWGSDLLAVWLALRAFGVDIGYGQLVIGYATGYASTMLPLPAGGAGGVDAASTYALTLVGVPLGPALLATLVQRVCTYWMPLGVALVGARSVRRLPDDLAHVPGAVGRG
ncbi:MAG TPA: lysylphosphatidylglycerol synthase transmembrane domain-containing protein [Acidimicrobiales bacterium]|nr:lysylphosphatidylglycerol synthase transmembrane domain-containing protein [Acidimicrobiales bacterium]